MLGPDLIVGIRGDFRLGVPRVPSSVETALSRAVDRCGGAAAWGACDSSADLETVGDDILRAWNHIAYRRPEDYSPTHELPLSPLFRATWDALELYGTLSLTGVDAIVPITHAGDPLWMRTVENRSILLDVDRVSLHAPRVLIQAARAWASSPRIDWTKKAVAQALAELVDGDVVTRDVSPASYPPPAQTDPFRATDENPFRAAVTLPRWTIDDAAWITEALASSCYRAGVRQTVLIAVRAISGQGESRG